MDEVIEIITEPRCPEWGEVAVCPTRGKEWSWGPTTLGGEAHWLGYSTKCPICKKAAEWKRQVAISNQANNSTVRLDELAAHLGLTVVHPNDVNQADIDAALRELQEWVS